MQRSFNFFGRFETPKSRQMGSWRATASPRPSGSIPFRAGRWIGVLCFRFHGSNHGNGPRSSGLLKFGRGYQMHHACQIDDSGRKSEEMIGKTLAVAGN
jgi:hypothetical protein